MRIKNFFNLFIIIFSIIFLKYLTNATLSDHFQRYILNNLDPGYLKYFTREDLGKKASYGGKNNDDNVINRRPVIIIHGISNKLQRFQGMINKLKEKGYKPWEVYGTTWGDGGKTPATLVTARCEYIKVIRQFIIAVSKYTNNKVDIIAYSMGSPLARKAIKGGKCVDTGEYLGLPLKNVIHTFISVAGANYGSSLCIYPIPISACNKLNGLYCGSTFMEDTNSEKRYEGEKIYSIFSIHDDKVGSYGCGKYLSPIIGGDGYIKKSRMNHDEVMDETREIQITLLNRD
ncbi:Lipase EstA/Esterase EstB family-containing protein [Strongyloides ratti]|uniref:Lipase EstA/Esterase EstB family-containing protein n=1 Tax=Strongyloides ratti TaxID=34506 RepID=A0A090MZD8_STRRB|nr:Lipase EstA/Esterase EstB family-containing protein [Strongyloides ratti]CEF68759.1 Lipase EstA/Esterase EstB family-containing protein [Strongyloides ratti]